jgi:heptosyltransferase-2
MTSVNKVLIIQTAFLGDAILISSLLEKIRIESPETIIHLLVRKGNESIFQAYPHTNLAKVWAYDKKQKMASWRTLRAQFQAEHFDQVFVAQRFFGMGLLSLTIGAKKVIGFDKNPLSMFFSERVAHEWGTGKHEVERNTALLSSWLGSKVYKPYLSPDVNPLPKGLNSKSYICISPGSVWETKRLPVRVWIDFIHLLPENQSVVLMGAPNEVHLAEEIEKACPKNKIINEAGKHGLVDAIRIYQLSLMSYVNDSGPMHICSAVDTPTVAVFCSTIPAFGFGPLATWNRIVEIKDLTCRPCGDHGKISCPLAHYACGNQVTGNQLLKPYEELLAARSE